MKKTAIVTGGVKGIGWAASKALHRDDFNVSILDWDEKGHEKIKELGRDSMFIHCDVSKETSVKEAINRIAEKFGSVDVLVNNAGIQRYSIVTETTEEEWDWLMGVNVKSMYLMTRAVLPAMLKLGTGSIVNTSSISAVAGTPNEVLYCTSKGACHMFTRAIAIEYRDQGIRCNAVCPGFIRTDHGLRELKELRALNVKVSEEDIATLQGRICEPEEVGYAALFLASREASFVNGETLFVDNGMLVGT